MFALALNPDGKSYGLYLGPWNFFHQGGRAMAHKSPGVIVALLCVLFLSGTALAEGSWASFLSQVLPGFESRGWTDTHVDHVATTVRFDGCRGAVPGTDPNDWAEVKLYREISFAPDEGFAIKRLYC